MVGEEEGAALGEAENVCSDGPVAAPVADAVFELEGAGDAEALPLAVADDDGDAAAERVLVAEAVAVPDADRAPVAEPEGDGLSDGGGDAVAVGLPLALALPVRAAEAEGAAAAADDAEPVRAPDAGGGLDGAEEPVPEPDAGGLPLLLALCDGAGVVLLVQEPETLAPDDPDAEDDGVWLPDGGADGGGERVAVDEGEAVVRGLPDADADQDADSEEAAVAVSVADPDGEADALQVPLAELDAVVVACIVADPD